MTDPRTHGRALPIGLALALVSLAQGCASTSRAEARFDSPDQAAGALVESLRSDDTVELARILGPDYDSVVFTDDAAADSRNIRGFVSAYDAKHRLVSDSDGTVTLVVGDADWPCPIPIARVADSDKWVFDTARGESEIRNRCIGRNELAAMQVCLAIVDAEREYAMRDLDGDGMRQYAMKITSDPGQKNGLYWKSQDGEPPSPLGIMVAAAEDRPSGVTGDDPVPYHGYFYRILGAQGPHADGGATDYVVRGQMIGGFAVVAFPAAYDDSGIMTFIANHRGVVYQNDLGPDTTTAALQMTAFDPGPEWTRVEPPAEDSRVR